jgi:uncharacterized protein (TIGR02996 family)
MTTTATRRDLLRNILDRPEDDFARLVYADFLDEQGEADRAEFIRVQVELWQKRGRSTWARMVMDHIDALRCRERELWHNGALVSILDEVRPAIPWEMTIYKDNERPGYTPTRPEAYVRRGFVFDAVCRCDFWLAHGSAVVACQPVERVTLDRTPLPIPSHQGLVAWWPLDQSAPFIPAVHHLPISWGCHLTGKYLNDDGWGCRTYPTPEAALNDLSRAALAWAKDEAEKANLFP